ncbi:Fpg/Nei family DNA glycosylase [Phytoactinopolyspora halotolerans]|uniref:Fpg/Nei family DNA glycosylase n=1 Tax=Phytoactinopolyspora halotolerans TaxID=1981512 RepID=A0A6L9S7M5_9ACTN|nr:Fpg/Nei family DNA glycosylase [Phytoactinopolyspora halotolerans]NED99969.1 Fpg/Nei family DNA glycosylase [Phytoactinopolyspora halotolerans]
MPELPDVEGFSRVLGRAGGRKVEDVEVLDAGVLRDTTGPEVRDAVTGSAFGAPCRHGKWLVAPLHAPGRRHRKDEPSIVFHFGMTGALIWSPDEGEERHRHDRLIFATDDGELRFRDMRKLQGVRLMQDDGDVDELLADSGPDAASIDRDELTERLGASRRRLKPALIDQSVVAGLGNLLADEILWQARLHPARSSDDLTNDEWRRLFSTMRSVLRQSEPVGRVPDRRSWLTGRRDEPEGKCPRCLTRLRHKPVGGRRTVWCPNCQPS